MATYPYRHLLFYASFFMLIVEVVFCEPFLELYLLNIIVLRFVNNHLLHYSTSVSFLKLFMTTNKCALHYKYVKEKLGLWSNRILGSERSYNLLSHLIFNFDSIYFVHHTCSNINWWQSRKTSRMQKKKLKKAWNLSNQIKSWILAIILSI